MHYAFTLSKALILHTDCGGATGPTVRAPVEVCVCVCVFNHEVPGYKCPLSPLFHPPLPWAGGPVECVRTQKMRVNGRRRSERERIKQRTRKQRISQIIILVRVLQNSNTHSCTHLLTSRKQFLLQSHLLHLFSSVCVCV